MKSLFLFACCLFSAGIVSAQTIVGTTPTNKNVILEELTGKTCGYCPDGHRRAKQLYDANPGRIVLLNIHTGGYAAGTPNYRTAWGDYVGGLFNVTGYPTGAVNRTDFGSGVMHSRGDWAANAGTVMGQASPANVGGAGTIDLGSRVLTVDVEAYYTAAGTGTSNKFHAIVTQDNIPGPQSGASGNPSAILPNGDYNHQHMVRHNLTPNAGDDITTLTATSLYTNQYTHTFPADINNITVNMEDLKVAVYVTEGASTGAVVTGAEANMTIQMPPNAHDVATSAGAFGSADYCANGTAWTPSFTAENRTANTITSIEAQYTVNGGAAVPVTMSGLSLANGQSTAVTFPAVALPAGSNDIVYSIVTLNGTDPDLLSSNNNGLEGTVAALTAAPTATTLTEDFQNANLPSGTFQYSQTLAGAIFENPDNLPEGRFGVFGENSSSIDVSNCIRAGFGFGDWNNASGAVVFDNIDLTNNAAPGLSFDYAHALFNAGSGDGALEIFISTDCGANWTSVWARSGTALATGAPISTGSFYPAPNTSDWAIANIDLTAYANQSSVAVKFAFSKGTSANHLYIDNINFDVLSSVTAIESVAALAIMPNPVRDIMNVEFSLEEADDLTIAIHNALGQQVQHVATENFVGANTISVNTSNLSAGVYFLNITSSKGIKTERFVVEK
ncbi:T9SS type A sorting domain-containing protein [Aureispira anguillae]|uniref:Omp28-related outer membrane protein n=1 Tax=Aureispira anguillae TaxID=2864201 RepID=A0A915YIM2_9BACT|nr:T9SS type A sorting domain-containing protein [Aureispira anguillae]BDS13888.1 Omp28-related outer membrane protein [Aureispira anguillae]